MWNTYQEEFCASPTMVSGWGWVREVLQGGEEEMVLFKLKRWSVLKDMVPDVGELIFAQVPV